MSRLPMGTIKNAQHSLLVWRESWLFRPSAAMSVFTMPGSIPSLHGVRLVREKVGFRIANGGLNDFQLDLIALRLKVVQMSARKFTTNFALTYNPKEVRPHLLS